MEKKMVMVFYSYAQKNKRFKLGALIISKASPFIFACIYFSAMIYLFKNGDAAFYYFITVPAATLLISYLLRAVIKRPRPYITCNLTSKHALKKSWSFPSNHTVCAGIIAFSCLFLNMYLGISVFFLAFICAMSRVFLGIHYPSDIAGGLVLSAAAAVIGYSVIPSLI